MAVQGCVLVAMACVVFWLFLIAVGANAPFRWCFGPLDGITDSLCLFLMFSANLKLYLKMCGGCHRCWSRCCFDGAGQAYEAVANDEVELDQAGQQGKDTSATSTTAVSDTQLL